MNVGKGRWRLGGAVAWAVAVSWLAVDAQKPPAPLPLDAPGEMFSAVRAHQHVEDIARVPHPMGSSEAERVRGVLFRKLEELGLSPEIQSPRSGNLPARNVLARLTGTGLPGKKVLMLSAHYDSVPAAPGAGDDASGVAVVLETIRALKAGPPLDRDVIALFNDGEENGFHGSQLFVNEHPWAKEVGVVLNFDARGNSGPSIMFETSDRNGWLIRRYAQCAPHPLATSLSMDIYRMMPNDTDLTTFKRAGIDGLNFAFGGGVAYYHSAEDTPENLDPSTLQHQGENALATAQQFGRLDLDNAKRDDVIYSSILSRVIVYYPTDWAIPLALAAGLLFLLVTAIGVRTGQIRIVDVFAGALVLFAAMCASLLCTGVLFLVGVLWSTLSGLSSGTHIAWHKLDVPILSGCALLATVVTLSLALVGNAAFAPGARPGSALLVVGTVPCHCALASRRQLSVCVADLGGTRGIGRFRAAWGGFWSRLARGLSLLDPISAVTATAHPRHFRWPEPRHDRADHDPGRPVRRNHDSTAGAAGCA